MSKWQSIETAPKHQMFIWAAPPVAEIGQWRLGLAYPNVSGGWSDAYGQPPHATHWMSLPPTPEPARQSPDEIAQQTVQRPDWEYIYRTASHEADRDDELVTVTRETARLASNALRKMNGEDFYDNNGAAEHELMDALEAAAAQPSREAALVKAGNDVKSHMVTLHNCAVCEKYWLAFKTALAAYDTPAKDEGQS